MNDVIVWGSLIIPIQLLFLILSGITGYTALTYRMRALEGLSHSKAILNELFNTTVIGLLIWKLSPLLFDTRFVIENPLSLLYFAGGTTGLTLAVMYIVTNLSYRTWKAKFPVLLFPDAILSMILAGTAMYSLLQIVFRDGGLLTGLTIPITVILYYLLVRGPRPLGHIAEIKQGVTKYGNLLTALIIIGMVVWALYDNFQSEKISSSPVRTELNEESGVRIGNLAADFTLTTLDGTQVNLSDYRGRRVLLNFWATWCPPCKAEMPHMERFYKAYQQEDIVILAVNLTHTEKSSNKVQAFVQDHELSFPIALDPTGEVSKEYKVRAYPTSFIIDSSGIIRDIYQGAISYETMKQAFY